MNEDKLLNLNIQIESLITEKVRIEKQLKTLREEKKSLERKAKLPEMIRRYEISYPDNIEHAINSLVKIGETFEEWVLRFGSKCKGGTSIIWLKESYEMLGYVSNNYIKWLVEIDDPRVIDTEFYLKKKEGKF